MDSSPIALTLVSLSQGEPRKVAARRYRSGAGVIGSKTEVRYVYHGIAAEISPGANHNSTTSPMIAAAKRAVARVSCVRSELGFGRTRSLSARGRASSEKAFLKLILGDVYPFHFGD
jgi:hypothetical protein